MARTATLITNFTAGEFTPRLRGRVDIEKYRNAAYEITNFVVVPHGGARKRPGFKYIVEPKSSSEDAKLVRFVYNTEQAYTLMFGPSYVWFFRDGALITHAANNITGITNANPAVVTSTGHTLSNGDYVYIGSVGGMHQLNNRRFLVANTTANTFELSGEDSTSFGTYTSGGTASEIVELATTYTESQLPDLQFAQTNDVLYICHPDQKPKTITRTSHTAWTLAEFGFEKGPFQPLNGDTSETLTFSSWSASATTYGTQAVGSTATCTATSGIFTSDMVGALIRVREGGDSGDATQTETGIQGASLGDGSASLANGDQYTTDGFVYGVSNVTTISDWGQVTRVPTHQQGTVRVYPSGTAGYFDATYLHDTTCVLKITAYTSSTVVTVQIIHNQMPESIRTSAISLYEIGSWNGKDGYPSEVAFHENRLWFASTAGEPQTIWASRSGIFSDFEDGTGDSDAIIATIGAGQADVIRWLSPGTVLTAGTSSSEMSIGTSANNEALTPSNIRVAPQTTFGSSATAPIRIGRITLFPQRSGDPDNNAKKLREYSYDFARDSYEAVDLTIFSEHITGDGMVELAYQLEPDQVVYAVREDGYLLGMTYERQQQVVAWHKHIIGGTSGKVKRCVSIPGTTNDDLYILSERTINGGTKRYIEVQAQYPSISLSDDNYKAAYIGVDCSISGAAADAEITGLYHLEGETVSVLNNGSQETHTVTNGEINLNVDPAGATVSVGLAIDAALETMDLEAGAQQGSASARPRNIHAVYANVYRSLGGKIGPNSSNMDSIIYRLPEHEMDSSPPLRSEYLELTTPSGWSRECRVRFEHDTPFPFMLTSLVVEMQTEESF